MIKKIGILCGGGDCPGLNPAIRAIVLHAMDYNWQCVGVLEGWRGLLENKFVPIDLKDVEEIVDKGGTIIGTSRVNPYKREDGPKRCMENMKKIGLDALLALGGEDTLGVAAKLYKEYKMPVVGLPKTMDNDLSATDYTFGFDSSVAVAVDAAERLKDTGKSHRRIMVLEVMGRHAGWVALFTGLSSAADWIAVPEVELDIEKMCQHLKRVYERKNYALVVVSEGVKIPDIEVKPEKLDEFGHMILKEKGVGPKIAKIIEKNTGCETRTAVIGHIQRGGAPTIFDRMLAIRTGVKAIELVKNGKFGYMVALRGNDIIEVPLEEAVGKLKVIDENWLNLMKTLLK